tara:strand:- start:458 stop:2527 length:2070 start_codon:yes stop_codon:yes gene_type:complete
MSLIQPAITKALEGTSLRWAYDFSQVDPQSLTVTPAVGSGNSVTFTGAEQISESGIRLDGSQLGQLTNGFDRAPLHYMFLLTVENADFFLLRATGSRYCELQITNGTFHYDAENQYNGGQETLDGTLPILTNKLVFLNVYANFDRSPSDIVFEVCDVGEQNIAREVLTTAHPIYQNFYNDNLLEQFIGIASGLLVFDSQQTDQEITDLMAAVGVYGSVTIPTNLNQERSLVGTILTADRKHDTTFAVAAGSNEMVFYSNSKIGDPLEFFAFDSDEGGSVYRAGPLDPSVETEVTFETIIGGGEGSGQSSKVSGVVQIDGTPAQRTVRAFSYDPTLHDIDGANVDLSKSLGHAVSDPETGDYTIDLLAGYDKRIFVVAFDDYGDDFTPDKALSVGDRVHPTTPNGHVWECTGAGTLPSEEPTWIVDTETAQLYGTASMIARPFYRPMVHGPVSPEVTLGTVNGDEYFNSVTLLTRFDGADGATEATDLSNTPATITFGAGAVIKTNQSKFGGASLYLNGSSNSYVRTNRVQNIGTGEFTLEAWIRPAASNTMRIISSQDLVNTQAVLTLRVNSDGALACFLRDKTSGAPTVYFFSAPGLVAMDGSKWHHAALTRDQSSKLTLWLDGTAVATQTSNANPTGNSNAYDIGHFDISQERWTGHIDEVRITEGVCRYTEAFTPPTQPFPNQGQA